MTGSRESPRALRQVEPECRVRGAAFVVHAGEHRNPSVDVVVHLDAGLGICWPEDSTDVLDDAALEPDWEREEQRVERRTVKSLTEQAGRRGQHESALRRWLREPLDHRRSGLLAHLAVENERFDAHGREGLGDRVEVLGLTREHQTVPTPVRRRDDVVAERRSPLAIFNQAAKRVLNVLALVVHLMIGLVHHQIQRA